MNASMFTASCHVGEVIYARTETAEYWMAITAPQVACVYRKGNGKPHATLLEKRRLGAQIVEFEPFSFYDGDGQPVSVIVPHEIKKVQHSEIPLYKG